MPKEGTARLFANGKSQAVRLPKQFRFPGEAVRIRRVGDGVLLQPIGLSPAEWFQKLDSVKQTIETRSSSGKRRKKTAG